jgi:N-acylneuraminate cytidylyltransferase
MNCKEKKRLLIIPARAGSKRVPNKNIRNFCGKPMIVYSIETAFNLGIFDEIHVSTESIVIKKVVEKAGCKVPFLRPESLSDDFTTTIDVYKFVVSKYIELGKMFDEVWTLLPCAPLLAGEDLHNAYKLFLSYESKFPVISVVECNCYESQSFDIVGDFLMFSDGEKLKVRSQDLSLKYKSAGAFGIFSSEHILNRDINNFTASSLGFSLSRINAVDIDNEEDWALAETIYYGKKYIEAMR